MKNYIIILIFSFNLASAFSQRPNILEPPKIKLPIIETYQDTEDKIEKKDEISFKVTKGCDEWIFKNNGSISSKICGTCVISHNKTFGNYYELNDTIFIIENSFGKNGRIDAFNIQEIIRSKKKQSKGFELELTGIGSEDFLIKRIVWKKLPKRFNRTRNTDLSQQSYKSFSWYSVYVKRILLYHTKQDRSYWVEVDQKWNPKKWNYKIQLWNIKSIIIKVKDESSLQKWSYKKQKYVIDNEVNFE